MSNQVFIQPIDQKLVAIEVSLLVAAIYLHYGYDFRDYALPSLTRRIQHIVKAETVPTISALQDRVLHDAEAMQRFLVQITVNVTSMFRDPSFYQAFRLIAVPQLEKQPVLRIWHAGCSSGEEVYSMAILLHEAGLLERSRIYATDFDLTVLATAKAGIYALAKMQEYTENYQAALGTMTFSKYYQAGHGHVTMRTYLRKPIFWAQHNLTTDGSFNEFHLILCRNVLIYFNESLQKHVHGLLYNSLSQDGLLVLGRQEDLQLTPFEANYAALNRNEKIYQRLY